MKYKEFVLFFFFVTLSALLIGILSTTDFIKTPALNWTDFAVLCAQSLVIFIAIWLFIYLLAINKYVFAIFYPVLTVAIFILAYYRYTLNAVLTPMIIDAGLDNDAQTSMDLITPGLIIGFILCLVLAIFMVVYRYRKIQLKKSSVHFILVASLFLFYMHIPRFTKAMEDRIPFNMYYITQRYLDQKEEIAKERPSLREAADCFSVPDSLTVVFVIGESLRADHLGINGYTRNTTPYLEKEDIISFDNIYCEQTYTNASIPHILTRADSSDYQLAYKERSFVDLFKTCGFTSSWLANQEGADSYIYFMHECDTLAFVNIEKSSYVYDKWVDESLYPLFDQAMNSKNEKRLIILHTIGSHWWYNSHFTDEFTYYQPIVKSKILSSCTEEELINSYDNTIRYTDYFLSGIIERLKDINAVLIYLSDHGESLGENGVWLHASDSPPIHNPAFFIWMSEQYKTKNPEKYKAAHENKTNYYRNDILFHSIIDAADIQSPYLKREMSVFN